MGTATPNSDVDDYIATSDNWPAEMTALRAVLLAAGLTEDVKWNKPCYSHGGRNIVILQEMKDFLAAMFFKGMLLNDPDDLLEAQGPNSRSAKRLCFTSVACTRTRSRRGTPAAARRRPRTQCSVRRADSGTSS